ncbi:hypothetical protein G6F63_015984 [Rhizopus arrhizus]|nr:hypothetical protein G6F63_015984 [Rhizopus arrhizus]
MRDVAQEEDAVSRSQRQRILPFAQVHPAAAVQDQMETGARPPAGAGGPIAAVLPQVIQAGLDFQAGQQQGVDGGLVGMVGCERQSRGPGRGVKLIRSERRRSLGG